MGLRGPLPTPDSLRAVRGGRRKRPAPTPLRLEVERELLQLAQDYHATATALLAHVRKRPTVASKANGVVANPAADKAAKFGEAATQILLRLGRLATPEDADAHADPLTAFQRAKH